MLVFAATCGRSAAAADVSPWNDDLRSAMRLIAGSNDKEQAWRAGVEIKMQPGWHTYWRYAGDSGVPPHFDFSGSENLKSATVLYPAPQTFDDGAGGKSLGYTGNVIFPVAVTPRDPAKPVQLHVKLDYAVCEKICVPATGNAALTLTLAPSKQDDALRAAEARVPQRASAAELGLTARRVNDAAKPMVMVDVVAAAGTQLLVEGPTPEWALPLPQPAQGAPAGHQHFSFVLDGLPPGVSPGKGPFDLTFTVITPARAYETTARLD
jgi:DsbC/DsbD-like thiol-disulfide interchange protein